MRNEKVLVMAEIAIMASLGIILDYLSQFISLPNGGSIGLQMIPIFVIAFRRGLKEGLITGFMIGFIQITYAGKNFLGPVQGFFDYYGAYMVVGFSGLFYALIRKVNSVKLYYTYLALAVIIGSMLRFVFHILSGMWFWETGFWASVTYNATYMIPSMIISVIIVCLLPKKEIYLLK